MFDQDAIQKAVNNGVKPNALCYIDGYCEIESDLTVVRGYASSRKTGEESYFVCDVVTTPGKRRGSVKRFVSNTTFFDSPHESRREFARRVL